MSTADELFKLKELLDSGVLTQEEFDKEKEKILGYKNPEKKTDKTPKEPEEKENLDKAQIYKSNSEKQSSNRYFLMFVSVISVLLIFYFAAEYNSFSISSTSVTTSSTSTTLPTTTSTLSDSEKQKKEVCESKKYKVLKKVATTYNILDDAFDQVIFVEDNGFEFEPSIQKLEDMNFYDFRNPQDETERKLGEIEVLLEAVMPIAIYGLQIYFEGYKQILEDGNDSRAENTFLQGDPYMDASFDEVSEIREKINKINC